MKPDKRPGIIEYWKLIHGWWDLHRGDEDLTAQWRLIQHCDKEFRAAEKAKKRKVEND
jgi:hypothetical protein